MWLQVIGRLKPGVTFDQAKASVNVAFKNMLESKIGTLSADDRRTGLDQRIELQPGARGSSTLHGRLGQPLKLLMVLVGLVLLIACANVANLLLARGSGAAERICDAPGHGCGLLAIDPAAAHRDSSAGHAWRHRGSRAGAMGGRLAAAHGFG